MTRTKGKDTMKIIALAFALLAAAGCSTLPRPTAGLVARSSSELHGSAPVRAGRAKALVRGPALIRHLEIEGDGAVALYLADDPGIGDRSCPSAGAEGASPFALLGRESRLTNVTVPGGKRVCAATEASLLRVAWHAQTGDLPRRSLDVALLSR